jgi:hypothetical protein
VPTEEEGGSPWGWILLGLVIVGGGLGALYALRRRGGKHEASP